jgi:hypothetical protein
MNMLAGETVIPNTLRNDDRIADVNVVPFPLPMTPWSQGEWFLFYA